ncbi:NAD(P)/FAD-dependent oxidoreductase [Vreelandella stevensii]|uniref:NAD(P)/FAD-dependent oxidoreductase n=1 Tax=Vreelandella stevensii TaxID=502821 RepID=UPI003747978D
MPQHLAAPPALTPHDAVAIIGAGMSGLACAHLLAQQGVTVSLFDKARGPGGRMSSKGRPAATLDLGAQAFTVRNADFAQQLAQWQDAGCVAPWPTCTYQASASGWQTHDDGQLRYTGAPRMSALTRYLIDAIALHAHTSFHSETRIVALERVTDGEWHLKDAAGNHHGPFSRVVITAPPPQASELIGQWAPELSAACDARPQRGCWAAWAIFAAPLPAPSGVAEHWQSLHAQHPKLRLVSRNHTKPGRDEQPESLSLIAQLDWSDVHIELPPEEAAQHLLEAFLECLPVPRASLPRLIELDAHRWRYAQAEEPAAQGYLYSQQGIALCGDSWKGSRVEDAWLSGNALARALIGRSV